MRYYPQCDNFWDYKLCPKARGKKINRSGCENRKWSKLTLAHIQSHLESYYDIPPRCNLQWIDGGSCAIMAAGICGPMQRKTRC